MGFCVRRTGCQHDRRTEASGAVKHGLHARQVGSVAQPGTDDLDSTWLHPAELLREQTEDVLREHDVDERSTGASYPSVTLAAHRCSLYADSGIHVVRLAH